MSRQIVEVETKTFIRFWLVILGFALAGFFLIRASEALAIICISVLLAISMRPLALKVNKLIGKEAEKTAKAGKPAGSNLASVLAYLIVVLAFAAIIAAIAPVVVSEMGKFLSSLPDMVSRDSLKGLNNLGALIGVDNFAAELVSSVEEFSKNILSSAGSTIATSFGTVTSILGKAGLTLILTLFFLLDGPTLINNLWDKIGAKRTMKDVKEEKDTEVKTATEVRVILTKMSRVVSSFVSNQVGIALMDAAATMISVFILSLIFGVEGRLAIPLGMITGTFYLIPMFGQIIGAVLVTIILLFNSPLMAVVWLVFYIVYGFVEVNIISPKIQGNSLNLRPLIILIAITIGTYMFGLFGAIIAIPIAGCVKVLIDELPNIRSLRK